MQGQDDLFAYLFYTTEVLQQFGAASFGNFIVCYGKSPLLIANHLSIGNFP
jgi:hypothetical protein